MKDARYFIKLSAQTALQVLAAWLIGVSNIMDKLLLVVEESFQISGRGVIVVPDPLPEIVGSDKSGYAAQVRLIRPDGSYEIVQATFYWAHSDSGDCFYTLVLNGVVKEQVPPDTRICLISD